MSAKSKEVLVPALVITLFASTVVLANWSIATFGFVPVGFGLTAPAGVFFAGLAFTFRDLIHEISGRAAVFIAIAIGGCLSLLIEDAGRIAMASAVAFTLSELADYAVYAPMRRRGWLRAVAASNAVGLVADSALFLILAFGSLAYLEGQIVGKGYMTILAIAVLWLARNRWNARRAASFT